jgi:MinD superfamily P-loop ATPase
VKNTLRPEILEAFHHTTFATPVIGVTGGKGGVGKTTVAVNLAMALVQEGKRVALVDCDVDAPNASLLLGLKLDNPQPVTITKPLFDQEKCTDCKACVEACSMNSLFRPAEKKIMLMGECNGCESCLLVCPSEAITRGSREVGTTYENKKGNLTLFTGALHPGLEESAIIVKAVRKRAELHPENYDVILVDTAPGTHCNVIDALQGADFVLAVTEPTPLAAHDLDLMLSLLDKFELERSVFINRSDVSGRIDLIQEVVEKHATPIEAGLKLDHQLLASNIEGVPVVTGFPDSPAAMTFQRVAANFTGEYLS